jgi:hypothetical protein
VERAGDVVREVLDALFVEVAAAVAIKSLGVVLE